MKAASVGLILIVILLIPVFGEEPSPTLKHEFRGVWLTTAIRLDWPKTTGAPAQEEELRGYIQKAKELGLNAIIFQAVARGDAMYQSDRLPWAPWLTGTPGEDPGWDPLAVAIEEAHSLGMEIHAWINIGLVASNHTPKSGSSDPPHVVFSHPEWIDRVDTNEWLNLAIPDARQWQVENVIELLENYAVDAVHFDYIRYHHRAGYERDDSLFQIYNPDGIGNINDWRRWNVTQFVQSVYAEIQNRKPWVKVGSAVAGHYQNIPEFTWPAFYGYTDAYQESRLWIAENIHDYLAAMMYWGIGQHDDNPRFELIIRDWMKETHGKHIYSGMGPYKDFVWNNLHAHIDTIRAAGADGGVFFRNDHIRGEPNPFQNRYTYPALIPSMAWKDSVIQAPIAPVNLTFKWITDTNLNLSWERPDMPDEEDKLLRYAVYRINSPSPPVFPDDLDDVTNLLDLTGETTITDLPDISEYPYYYFVTSLNRNFRESDPSDYIAVDVVSATYEPLAATTYTLHQNYPNPFNPETVIQFSIPAAQEVTLKVYDLLGREVAVIVDSHLAAGEHRLTFDASGLVSGMYIYRIIAGEFNQSKRMMLVR